jgi:hypothetical protein
MVVVVELKKKIDPYQVRDVTKLLFPDVENNKTLSEDIDKIKDKYCSKETNKNNILNKKK